MKRVLYSVLVFLLAMTMLVSFAACGDKIETPTDLATTTQAEILSTEEHEPVDVTIAEPGETSTPDATTAETTTADATITTGETTVAVEAADPLKLFNDATKLAVSQKAGYSKTRFTKITELDFGTLGKIQAVKDEVYKFFDVGSSGEGSVNYNVNKGTSSDQLRASTWTASDIKSANAEPDGKGGYVVTILVKDGSTSWSGKGGDDPGSGMSSSYIDKGPLCYGTDGNGKYDHKTARNMYLSINIGGGAITEGIGESTRNVKFVANIDAQGRLQKLSAHMDMTVDIRHVKVSFVTITDKMGKGYSEVTYENFKY